MRGTLKLIWINRVGVTDADLPAEQVTGPADGRSGELERGRVALPPIPATPSPAATPTI